MPSIFSDQMRDQILDEFKGVEVPRLSQSIINRFGQNPRNEGVGQLSRSQGFLIGENDPTSQRPGPIWDFPNDFPVPNENPDRPRRVPSPPPQDPLRPPEPPLYEGPLPPGRKPPVVAPEFKEGESNRLGELYEQLKLRIPSRTSSGEQERAPKMQPRGMNRGGGLGALEAEQYRAAVDAPLYANSGTTGGIGQWFSDSWNDYLSGFKDSKGNIDWKDESGQFAGLLKLLSVLGTKKKPQRSPTSGTGYRAPKLSQMKGAGRIGMNDGGTVLNRKLFLGGGEVDGIGGERSDLVPIWASDREHVVSANGVRRMGGGNHARGIAALDEINNNGRLV